MTRNIRLRKLFSATVALTLALCMLLPTSVFARQEWDGARVRYEHLNARDEMSVFNDDENPVSEEWVFCICPTRDGRSTGKNADYRFRYNLSNNKWMFDNTQNLNRRDGTTSDYMLDSGTIDFLSKVLYTAAEANGSLTAGNGTYSYWDIEKAVFWAVVYGKASPTQTIRGGGYVGSIYNRDNAHNLLVAASNATLPNDHKLWLYVPDSNGGAGNLQNTVNLTYDGAPTNPLKTKIQFQFKKEVDGDGAPALKGGEYTFVITGPNGYEERVTNDENGIVTSPIIEYTDAQLWQESDGKQRTFSYVITEEEGSDPNIEYDDKKVDLNVNVSRIDAAGNLSETGNKLTVNIWGRVFANSDDNADTPAMFNSYINTFTNEYTKPEAGPEITNTTVTLGGQKATSDEAAQVTVPAGDDINVTLSDEVKFSGLDSSKNYTIVSILTTGKNDEVQKVETTVSGKEEGTETVNFTNLTAEGEYYIKTELKDGDKVLFTHNGSLDDKAETGIIKQNEAPKITNTTAVISDKESTKSAPAEYKLGASAVDEGTVAVSFKDKVYFSNLEENKTYKIKSIVYKGDTELETVTTENITSQTESPVEVKLSPLDGFGTYTVKSELIDASNDQVLMTHNGNFDENSETVKITRSPYDPVITNTTATMTIGGEAVDATKFNAINKSVGKDEEFDYPLIDTVSFKGLEPNVNYTLVSTLYKNGEAQGEGMTTTVSASSPSESPEMTVEMGSITSTGKYTIKSELKDSDGNVVFTHNGKLSDRAESATITDNNELKTTVKANGDEADSNNPLTAFADELVSFTDVIEYKNLTGGKKYRVTGKLKEVDENGEVKQNEDGSEYNVAEAESVLTAASNGTGEWELEFDGVTLEPGKKYVVFEEAVNIKDEKDRSEHKNPKDNAQTIVTKTPSDIKISKKFLGGDEVAGADMKLTGGPDEINETWTSGTNAKEFSVKPGDYTLTEVVAPAGLKTVTTKMNFTVDSEGKVTLKTTTVDNGGKITVQEGNHIILEDAPDEPGLVKTVNDDKETTFKSVNGTVEFQIKATVPYGVTSFSIKDDIPKPLLYVEDSLVATLGGKDLLNYDSSTGQYGASATGDTSVEVFVLSPDGPSTIKPEDAWGEEVVLTLKCKINPEEDLSKYKDPVVNVALLEMDGTVLEASDDNEASVLGIYELAENPDANDDEIKGASKKGANTGDDTPIGWAVVGLLSAALALDMMRRRRMN